MEKKKRTYSERKQYIIRAVHKRRKKIRMTAVEYKGGKCEVCGYDRCIEALEFHHRDPSQKDFSVSADGCTRSWARVKKELDKCVMLCANCHREVHAKLAASRSNAGVNKWANSGKSF
jgi:predicted HNH restriction endonuclease